MGLAGLDYVIVAIYPVLLVGKFFLPIFLERTDPNYQYLPGLSVLIGGMWIMNLSYWRFNQYIIQRALAANSLREAQKGIVFAAFLKLLIPVPVVFPGSAAIVSSLGSMMNSIARSSRWTCTSLSSKKPTSTVWSSSGALQR